MNQPQPPLERELAQARAELEDFTYSVSHDLRASLRHIHAYVQIIAEDLGEQGHADLLGYLDTVSQAAQHMGRQIDALTELSRLTRLELQCAPLPLAPLLRDVCAALAPTDGRPLQWQLADDFPPLWGDVVLLRQVLTHLLSNAVKFTGTRALAQVGVAWALAPDGRCRVTVTDNGVGFNPQYQHKLFHLFQRLHGVREFDGLGTGLALTRKIIERHGGIVHAEGVPDVGCSVSFTLALAPH